MDILTHYKESYYSESQLSDKFEARLQIPTALLIALIGYQAHIFEKVDLSGFPLGVSYFCFFYIISIIVTFAAAVMLFLSWGGSKYMALPYPEVLEDYRKSLIEYYENDEEDIKNAYRDILIDYYINCSSHNAKVNEERARNLFFGFGAMSLAAALSLISYIPYYSYDLKKDEPTKVEVINT